MDDIVRQAMAKWPNVPACYGWLGLDARGQWWLRDGEAQACGGFASGREGARGTLLRHEKLIDFIGRNYDADERGCWYFQNGPQRVFVELEAAPWVWRLHCTDAGLQLKAHTGQVLAATDVRQLVLDDEGHLYLQLPRGLGLVHSRDMDDAARALELGWLAEPQELPRGELAARFGYRQSPQAPAAVHSVSY
jgi:hypothetical protein